MFTNSGVTATLQLSLQYICFTCDHWSKTFQKHSEFESKKRIQNGKRYRNKSPRKPNHNYCYNGSPTYSRVNHIQRIQPNRSEAGSIYWFLHKPERWEPLFPVSKIWILLHRTGPGGSFLPNQPMRNDPWNMGVEIHASQPASECVRLPIKGVYYLHTYLWGMMVWKADAEIDEVIQP